MGERRIVRRRVGCEKLVNCRISERSTTAAEGGEDFTEKEESGMERRGGGRHRRRKREQHRVVGRKERRQGFQEIPVETTKADKLDGGKGITEDIFGLVPESAMSDL